MDKKLAGLLGAAATLSTMTAAQAGPRAGAPRGYQLSQPSRPDPERPAAAESRRSTDGAKRRYPDRPGRGRTSSPSSPSSLKRKGVRLDALFLHAPGFRTVRPAQRSDPGEPRTWCLFNDPPRLPS